MASIRHMIYIKQLSNSYLLLGITLLLILGIGYLDHVTGYEIASSIFYLFPISFFAMFRGSRRPMVIFTALFSAIIWGLSEIISNETYSNLLIPYWNAFVRLSIFLTVGLLLLDLKNKHQFLLNSNKELENLNESISTKSKELVTELNYCFSAFDDIIVKYRIEKIKTIGDAYMCVGGIPVPFVNHAVQVVLAAIEIADFMQQYKRDREKLDKKYFEIRIGIHTGQLIAGVVGKHKFAYDVWGDTVNYASRLEGASLPGMINISEATYQLVRSYFSCTYRGKIAVKNKIETNMYFIESLLPQHAEEESDRVPNVKLKELIGMNT